MDDNIDMLDPRRRRAAYRAAHRGTKEMDIMVGIYARAKLADMSDTDLDAFEDFLQLPDPQLQGWLLNPQPLDDVTYRSLVNDIRTFHGLTTAK